MKQNTSTTKQEESQSKALAPTAQKDIKAWIQGEQFHEAVRQALPSHLTPERFIRVALTALMRTPELANCTQASLFKCMLDLSSVGLEPDGRRAHLIPYRNSKNNTVEAQLIIDYKGLIELAKRSGEVKNWRAEVVCENDKFGWENGIVDHKVDWLKPRGKVVAVYSHIRNASNIDDYEVMTLDEVMSIKKRSRAGNYGPWVTDFNEMAKKTVMRRHSKKLTLSPEFMSALDKDDDQMDMDIKPEIQMPKRLSQPNPEPVATSEDELPPLPDDEPPPPDTPPPTPKKETTEERTITQPQAKRLYAIAKNTGHSDDQIADVLARYGYEHSNDIKRSDYEKIVGEFESAADEPGSRG
jgi:recombination protein RecT